LLGGSVVLRSRKGGERVIAAEAFQQDMLSTARGADELITAVRFPVTEGKGVAFNEVARRHGDFAMIAIAAIADSRGATQVGVGGMAGRPIVRSLAFTSAPMLSEQIKAWGQELEGYDDLHASAAMRRDIFKKLAPRVIEEAVRCAA
jgi:2-furoyl-CoA dehydrogenase FAD binding subunit